MPCSCALRAAFSAARPAAYGVLLREPLKPTDPELAQVMTLPSGSVIVTIVLLKLDWTYALPRGTTLRSRRRGRAVRRRSATALLLAAGAGHPAHRAALAHPAGCRRECGTTPALKLPAQVGMYVWLRQTYTRSLAECLATYLLLAGLLAAGHRAARPPAGARVRARALAAHGQPAAVPQAPVAADLHQPLDVQVHLAAQVALDRVLVVDQLADAAHLVLGQLADALRGLDIRPRDDLLCARASDAVDVRQRDEDRLVARYVDARDTCHPLIPSDDARPPVGRPRTEGLVPAAPEP